MRRWVKISLLVVPVAILAAVFAAPRLIETDWARDRVRTAIEQRTGRRVDLGAIRFGFTRGLEVKDLVIHQKNREDERLGPLAAIPDLTIRIGLGDLLARRLRAEKIAADRPSIVLVRNANGRINASDLLGSKKSPPEIEAAFTARDARLLFADRKLGTSVNATELHLEGSAAGQRVSGTVDGKLNGGDLHSSFELDLSKSPLAFHLAEVKVEDAAIDTQLSVLAPFVPLLGDKARQVSGKLRFAARDLRGAGADLNNLRGGGELSVSGGLIASGPVLQIYDALRALLHQPGSSSGSATLRFDAISSRFQIAKGRVDTDQLIVRGPGLELVLSGWTRFDGTMRLDVTPKDLTAIVTDARARSLLERARFVLEGTLSSPRASIDVKSAAEKGLRSVLEDEIRRRVDVSKVLEID